MMSSQHNLHEYRPCRVTTGPHILNTYDVEPTQPISESVNNATPAIHDTLDTDSPDSSKELGNDMF